MSSRRLGYKSAEKVVDSSSDDESVQSPRGLDDSPSAPSRSPSPSSESGSSSRISSPSRSPTRTPSPDPDSYQYAPPTTHQLSTSKAKSTLPNLRTGDELFLLRIPRGVTLNNVQFNLKKRKVRIGEEEWKLVDGVTGDINVIQPVEDSENYEFGMQLFSRGLSVVRDVQLPKVNGVSGNEVEVVSQSKKRKHDGEVEDVEIEKRRKREHEKQHKTKEKQKKDKEKHGKEKDMNKDKERSKDKDRSKDKVEGKEKHRHKTDKDKSHKSDKHKHRHS